MVYTSIIQKTTILAMTAHELAKKLLEGPDLPVIIEGLTNWDEVHRVSAVCQDYSAWNGLTKSGDVIELQP